MTEQTFSHLLGTVYATFGRPVPQGDIRAAIWLRVQDVPDEACGWIASKLCDEERLPANMGRALAQAWNAWLMEHPERFARAEACPECRDGWLDCWSEQGGKWRHWVAPCPRCRATAGPAETREQLAARGVSVMPAEYRGGPLAFDRDNGFDALGAVSGVSTAWREAAQKLPDMLPDTRRFRALSDAELADVAACRRQEARTA